MMCKIYNIVGEYAITVDGGQKVYDQIHPELVAGNPVELDFTGVKVFASPFFNFAIGHAVPVNLTVDEAKTDAALNRFKTQAVDGYDLLILEAMSRAGVGQVKIITDDMDYAAVPDILVFTSNHNVVQTAIKQKKIMRR